MQTNRHGGFIEWTVVPFWGFGLKKLDEECFVVCACMHCELRLSTQSLDCVLFRMAMEF